MGRHHSVHYTIKVERYLSELIKNHEKIETLAKYAGVSKEYVLAILKQLRNQKVMEIIQMKSNCLILSHSNHCYIFYKPIQVQRERIKKTYLTTNKLNIPSFENAAQESDFYINVQNEIEEVILNNVKIRYKG